MKKIRVITHANFTSEATLFFEHKGDVICLHDDAKAGSSELGWFKVWYDSDMNEREYITINDTILYLDTIDEL